MKQTKLTVPTAAENVACAALQLISSRDQYQQLHMGTSVICSNTSSILLCMQLAMSPIVLGHLIHMYRCFRGFSNIKTLLLAAQTDSYTQMQFS